MPRKRNREPLSWRIQWYWKDLGNVDRRVRTPAGKRRRKVRLMMRACRCQVELVNRLVRVPLKVVGDEDAPSAEVEGRIGGREGGYAAVLMERAMST